MTPSSASTDTTHVQSLADSQTNSVTPVTEVEAGMSESTRVHTMGPTSCRRIQVSREKRPLNFFVTLSKKFLLTDNVIELSGLGLAVTTVVTIAEILKAQGLVYLQHIETSLVEPHPDGHTAAPKAKIQIWIHKTADFDSLMPTFHHMHGRNTHAVVPATPALSVRIAQSDSDDKVSSTEGQHADTGDTNEDTAVSSSSPPPPPPLPLPALPPSMPQGDKTDACNDNTCGDHQALQDAAAADTRHRHLHQAQPGAVNSSNVPHVAVNDA